MRKNRIVLAIALIIGSMLACNLPSSTPDQQNPDAILTAAALTVQAQLSANNTPTLPPADTATSAPSANTPTFTPVPLATATSLPAATATSSCDSALFVTDVTYPDNTVVTAGTTFTKTWRLQNTGSCSWTPSYALVFVSGSAMNGPTVQAMSGNVNPGQTVDVSVNLQAPSSNGTYTGNWGLRNASGVIFTHFYVQIKVTSGGGGGPFAVIHVTYNFTTWSSGGFVNCPEVIAHITTNGAGTVTYHWTRSDGASASTNNLTFSSAGTQDITDTWSLGSYWSSHVPAGGFWMGIYIDSPNNQSFGHKSFTTACTSP